MEFSSLLSSPAAIWFIGGLAALVLELIIPGVFLLFFGIGAWIVSLLCFFFPEMGLNLQLSIFIICSLASLLLLRKYLRKALLSGKNKLTSDADEEMIGKKAHCDSAIEPGKYGKVSFRGTTWTATSDLPVEKGATVEIISNESIILIVKPI